MTSLHPARYPGPAERSGQAAAWPPGPGAAYPARQAPVPPPWGWKIPGAGRAAHVAAAPEYQGTTTQVCGLFPFTAGSAPRPPAPRSGGISYSARWCAWTRWPGCAPG